MLPSGLEAVSKFVVCQQSLNKCWLFEIILIRVYNGGH